MTEDQKHETYGLYINGEWVDSADSVFFDVYNPYNDGVVARVASGTREDTARAIDAAQEAFPRWAALPPSEKRFFLLKVAEIMERRKQEFALMLSRETGAATAFAMFQAGLGPNYFREAASQVHRVMGKTIPAELPGSFSMILRRPVGVVAGISPWNGPLILSLRAVCFPIAYGNTVVLKPSAESPVTGGVFLAQVFEEAGFPKGVMNVITNGPGRSSEIGDALVDDKRVKRISFTGSTQVGRELAEKAGRNLKKITLELGGNDPVIVLRDADLDYAVNVAIFGRFLHQGQVCMNAKRIIVEKEVAPEFIEKFVKKASGLKMGNPLDPETIIGPLINDKQLEKIKKQVARARAQGAKLLCGGRHEGRCYFPTVLSDVTEEMEIFYEEVFGPVAPVILVNDAEEALRAANNSPFGLSSAIVTTDVAKGLDMAERLEAGVTHINDSPVKAEAHAPVGGVKDSGWGRHGMEAMEEFTEIHWVTIQKTQRRFPF